MQRQPPVVQASCRSHIVTLRSQRLAHMRSEEGFPSERYGSHSLRVGGATALYHAGVPVEVIKRYGRWVSDCFQGYLWD